jgi:8-amino-7-oxononanoate synthase
MRLSGARKVIVPHLDVTALERALMTPHPGGRTFVVTESLFSMAGDIAPLDSYAELTRRHGAELIVDDAHAVGVYGDQRGSGLVEHFGVSDHVLATLSTFGKALGLYGACVAGSRVVVDYLVNRARPFIFSTAPAPFFLAAVETALEIVAAEPERRQRVLSLARRLREALGERGIDCLDSSGPIVPVMVGDNERALEAAEQIRRQGFDVRAIRPPSVAVGTARLRISVHADHTEAQIDALAAILPPATALAKSAGETSKQQAVT